MLPIVPKGGKNFRLLYLPIQGEKIPITNEVEDF